MESVLSRELFLSVVELLSLAQLKALQDLRTLKDSDDWHGFILYTKRALYLFGITQNGLGAMIGVSQGAISGWIDGSRTPHDPQQKMTEIIAALTLCIGK